MTYQESFANALILKNCVRLYDEQAWIYFIFSSETEFTVKVFNTEPSNEVKDRIVREAFSINKVPTAAVYLSDGVEKFSYHDLNITIQFDLKSDNIIYFDGEESTPIDMDKVRKSFKELLGKLK